MGTTTAVTDDFWNTLEQLVVDKSRVIDRPKDSHPPRYSQITYPLDYGYLEGTLSADGNGIDIWVGSQPSQQLIGIICTFDIHKQDAEIKLLIGCSSTDIQTILDFHNNGMKAIFIPHPTKGDQK